LPTALLDSMQSIDSKSKTKSISFIDQKKNQFAYLIHFIIDDDSRRSNSGDIVVIVVLIGARIALDDACRWRRHTSVRFVVVVGVDGRRRCVERYGVVSRRRVVVVVVVVDIVLVVVVVIVVVVYTILIGLCLRFVGSTIVLDEVVIVEIDVLQLATFNRLGRRDGVVNTTTTLALHVLHAMKNGPPARRASVAGVVEPLATAQFEPIT
jgi:hypothetical protein